MAGEASCKLKQGWRSQIGEQQIGLHSSQKRMGEPGGLQHAELGRRPVLPGIRHGGGDGPRVRVACDDVARSRRERPSGGDGKDAGSGADIEDRLRPIGLQQAIECEQAAACARMMRRAEGNTGVDLQGETPMADLGPVVTAMHEEAAGANRSPQAFG